MTQLLNRINELAKKSKTAEGLTDAEKIEQKKLRKDYIKQFRGTLDDILLNSTIIDPEGTDVTPEKLKKAQMKKHLEDAKSVFKKDGSIVLDADKKE